MKKHRKEEQTLVIIKPDGIQRSLVGTIITRFERIGLKITALKMKVPNDKDIDTHYTCDEQWLRITGEKSIAGALSKGLTPFSADPVSVGKRVLRNLKKYMTSGPIIIMVFEGAHAVSIVRKITGSTEPLTSDIGTIRGDFVLDSYEVSDADGRSVRNLIHASSSVAEAEKEITHWFTKKELIAYRHIQEKILYDINLDGFLE